MTAAPVAPGMEGLRTDAAPPLSIPLSFFLVSPLAMMATGTLLVWGGEGVFASRWSPLAMAATHLGTLGFLGAAMIGALYQLLPVVAGAPVPAVRLAHAVHALLVVGVGALATGLATGAATFLALAPAFLLSAFLLFLIPALVAVARTSTKSETVWGMRLALLGLLGVAALGAFMALARAGYVQSTGNWGGYVAAHAALGGAVWVGGLLTAISWQVVPMFYLTPPLPEWSRLATLGAQGLALTSLPCVLLVGGGGPAAVALCTAPLALVVWLVHPVLVVRALRARRRRRVDGSVRFWWLAMALAPAVPLLAALSLASDDGRFPVALGWLFVWGWAGAVVHGMLTRIVPFLIWFHRYASHVGLLPVPSMRELLPDTRIRAAMVLHALSVTAGLLAILSRSSWLARATGAGLFATGALLTLNLVQALLPRRARA